MTLKIVAILITTVVGLIQIALEYKWHDKRTAIHKKIRVVLISLMIVGFSTAAVLIYLDDRDARDRLATLIDLKSSAEKSADDAERREQKAHQDRLLIQQNLDELKFQMEPFISLAIANYPNLDATNALSRLSNDIKSLGKDLEKTKSTIHSLTSRLVARVSADWIDGKIPVTPGIISLGTEPELTYSIILSSGDRRMLELRIDGMATVREEGNTAIVSYRAKASPESWIVGHDLRDIEGIVRMTGALFGINRTKIQGTQVHIEHLLFEIYANERKVVSFDQRIGKSITIPEGTSFPRFEFRPNRIIKHM